MARTPLTKAKKFILLILALIALVSSLVVSIAVFTDRVNRTTTIQVSSFDDDGYSIERSAPEGYVTAGETLEVTLKESNDKSENITSQITMTVSWDSPVPNVYPWGNTSADNAIIKLGNTEITYTVNADKTITFTLPETTLNAGSDVTSKLTFQIPADLASTGTLNFNFDQIELGYASWTANYDSTKLDALDFSVDVAWNISKNPTNTVTGNPNLDVISVLKDDDNDGKYELVVIKNGAADNTNKGQMMDWTAKDKTPWANYPIEDLTIDDGVTTIGDYAFAGETGISSVDLPNTITHIGTSAFDGSGLTGELVIPASVEELESLAFGNLPGVTVITFEHGSDDTLKLPDNESEGKENTGAFYVPSYVQTTVNTENEAIKYDYSWHNDNRMPVPTLAAQNTWYQGTTAQNTITSITILDYYEPAGTLAEPAWDASAAKDGSVMAYVESDGSGGYKLTIAGNGYGSIYANADSTYAFGAEDSTSADAFSKATSISDLNLLDTSNTTSMKGMFKGCSSATALNVSAFDTQKVTNMNSTFCDCAKVTALDVSQFDVQNVTDTSSMFYNCTALTALDVDGFDTRNVSNMSSMFAYCEKLTSLDVGLFDTQKVTSTESMFEGCYVLPALDVKKESVTLNGRTYTAWDTGAVKTMASMFAYCNELGAMDLSNWDATSVETMYRMFYNCYTMPSVNLTNFSTTSTLKNLGSTFYGCQTLPTVDLSSFTTSGVEDMSLTFFSCYDLTDVIRGTSFDATSVKTLNGIFGYCQSLTTLDLGNFNVSNALTNMYQMFRECTNLQSVDLSNWDTSNVTNMASLFYKCRKLEQLDLSMFDTAKVTTTSAMFNECNILTTIYVSQRWSNASNTYSTGMFSNNYALVGGAGTPYSSSYTDATRALIDGEGGKRGYFTNNIFLSYEDVKVGNTVDSNLTIKSTVFDDYINSQYEIISGENYVTVNTATGTVTGKAKGTATIQVTLLATNGDTITAQGTVKVLAPDITDATLEYDDVKVGETVDPDLGVTPATGTDYTTWYEVISGSGYASVDETTGVVTGKAKGTAIIRVTVTDENGNVITADGTVNVITSIPTLAATNTWFEPTNSAISKSVISGVTLKNSYTPSGTVVDSWPAAVDEDGDGFLDDDITVYVEDDGLGNGTYKMTIAGNGNPYGIFYANEDSSEAFKSFTSMTSFNNSYVMDTSKVKYLGHYLYSYHGMFQACDALTSLDLSSWDTSQVQSTISLFEGCDNLSELNLTGWDMSSCKRMVYMFSDCPSLETVDIGNWNTSKVVDMAGMFEDSILFNSLDVATKEVTVDGITYTAWNVGKVEDMGSMFRNCESLPYLDVSNWDVGEVEDMLNLFSGCSSINGLNVTNWDTSSVEIMQSLFGGCTSLTSIDVSKWNVDSVTDMGGMFLSCSSLPSVDVATKSVTVNGTTYTAWNTSNVEDMGGMFNSCSIINGMDMTGWNTSSVTDMSSMFSQCYALVDPSVQNFDTSSVEDMEAMFYRCHSIKTLDLSKWVTSNVTATAQDGTHNGMFYDCQNLTTIYATDRFDVTNVTESDYMFGDCFNLVGGAGTTYSSANDDKAYAHVDGGTSNPGYFTNNVFLAYEDIEVGETATPTLTIRSAIVDANTSKTFAIVSGNGYATVDAATGVVTGTAIGTATVRVTFSAANGDTLTADAIVNITSLLPVLASDSDWYTQGGTSISQKNITSITLVDEIDSATKAAAGDNYWDASDGEVGTVTAYAVLNDDNTTYSLTIAGNGYGSIYANEDSSYAFSNSMSTKRFSNLTSITGLNLLDTSNVTDMDSMFYSCQSLTSLDVSTFDTSKVESMSDMFSYCKALETLNISTKQVTMNGRTYNSWDTGAVETTEYMFQFCSKLSSLDLSHFDTSAVTKMSYMFSNCTALKTLNVGTKSVTMNDRTFNSWDTGNVQYMDLMFSVCTVLPSLDISHFDTSAVIKMNYMFNNCNALSTLNVSTKSVTMNNRTFNSWDTGSSENMSYMFYGCTVLPSLDVSHFDTSQVTTMSDMFSYCEGLTTLNVGTKSVTMNNRTFNSWDTGAVTDMYGMFSCCHGLLSLDVSHFDTGTVTDMGSMFYFCDSMTTFNISAKSMTLNNRNFTSWNTGSVTNMRAMFGACEVLTTLNLSHFNTAQVTDMSGMFRWCEKLYTLDISSFNTSSVTDMAQMFSLCKVLPSLDVSHFDTSSATNMYQMFEGCYDITSIKFSSKFKTDKVTNMGAMFSDCRVLTELDLSSFSTASITSNTGLAAFAYNSWALSKIIFNENFVTDTSLLPVAGFDPFGMFYTGNYITTTLVNPTAAMQSYDWAEDNRTIIIETT